MKTLLFLAKIILIDLIIMSFQTKSKIPTHYDN